jgi:hypothetical protein
LGVVFVLIGTPVDGGDSSSKASGPELARVKLGFRSCIGRSWVGVGLGEVRRLGLRVGSRLGVEVRSRLGGWRVGVGKATAQLGLGKRREREIRWGKEVQRGVENCMNLRKHGVKKMRSMAPSSHNTT